MTNKMFKGPEILGAGKKRKEVSPARALQGGPASISAGPPERLALLFNLLFREF
jgi:hypothetical protein